MLPMLSQHADLLVVEVLLQELLKNVLHQSYCLTFVMEETLSFKSSFSFLEIVTNGSDYEQFVKQILQASDMGCSDFIVRTKEPGLFIKALEEATHLGLLRRGDKKIIIIGWDEHANLLEILSMKEVSYLPNILLIIPVALITPASDCDDFDIFTHQYTGPDETSNRPLRLGNWNSCTMKFDKNADLFPHNDVSNLYGKTLRVGSFTYPPFTLLDILSPLGRDGTEIRVMDEFCKRINCTIEIVRNAEDNWGEIYDNMTGTGLLGSVVEDHADVGIPIFTWYDAYIWLDFSVPSIRSGVTCIAPAPGLVVSWDMPLLPFRRIMWIGMVLTFFLSSLAFALAQRSFHNAFLATFGILTGQTYDETRISWRIRSITGWLILTGLVLSNAYDAGLSSTYTVPRFENPIDTIQDLVDMKMEWGGTDGGWVLSISLSEEPLTRQLINQFRAQSSEDLRKRSLKRDMAFAVEKLPTGCLGLGDYITPEAVSEYRLIKEDFYFDFSVAILRKSSPYTQRISDLVLRLHETGLMLAFESQVASKHLDYRVQNTIKSSRSKKSAEIQPLTSGHVVGVFYMYMVGMGISFIIFLVEVCFQRNMYNVYASMK